MSPDRRKTSTDPRSPTTARAWRTNLLVALVALVATLAALELGLRIVRADASPAWQSFDWAALMSPPEPSGLRLMKPDGRWIHRYSSDDRGYFDEGNQLVYRTNAAGFRDGEFRLSRRGVDLRIAFLGDSFGFGIGVRREHVAATLLEGALAERTGCGVEVQNFSVPGYSASDEALLLEHRVLDYRPDGVAIWYFLNDVEIAGTLEFLGAGARKWFLPWMQPHSALARFVGARVDAKLNSLRLVRDYREAHEPDDPRWQKAAAAIERMAVLSRRDGIRTVLFVHPVLYSLDDSYPFSGVHRRILDLCRELDVPAVDLLPAFEGRSGPELWVHASDQHPNEVAHALAAERAAEFLAGRIEACAFRRERSSGHEDPGIG